MMHDNDINCGLLLICHFPLATAFLEVAEHILGNSTKEIASLNLEPDCDIDEVVSQGMKLLKDLDQGKGVVLFSDSKGATPANVALQLHENYPNSSLIYGLSLPMLLRGINYQKDMHNAVATKALKGALQAIQTNH